MSPLITPNWHIAAVHFPIALLTVGVLLDVLSFFGWRRHSLRVGARWMILAGAVLGVPAALSGVYAYHDLFPDGLAGIADVAERATVRNHVLLQSLATAAALVAVVTWVGASDRWRHRLHVPLTALMLLVVGTTLAGAHFGGRLVYAHGVGVRTDAADASADSSAGGAGDEAGGEAGAAASAVSRAADQIAGALPPLETHVIAAGFALALAAVALGLSVRAVSQPGVAAAVASGPLDDEASVNRIAAAFSSEIVPPADPAARLSRDDVDVATGRPAIAPWRYGPNVPAGRFWLLAAALLLMTAAGGVWVLARDTEADSVRALWEFVRDPGLADGSPVTRRLAHVVAGVSLVVLSLILAVLARFAPRRAGPLWVVGTLLMLAMLAQLWLGLLLILNGPAGSVVRFQ